MKLTSLFRRPQLTFPERHQFRDLRSCSKPKNSKSGIRQWIANFKRISPVVHSRSKALRRSSVLFVPVIFTYVTLAINFRTTYDTSQKVAGLLPLLQILAKVHDLTITFSLSEVILHHLRKQLLSAQGACFGLIGASYNIGAGGIPLSGALWCLGRSAFSRRTNWRVRWLLSLLFLNVSLSILANPAASILLVPRLAWWRLNDAISLQDLDSAVHALPRKGYSLFMPRSLFPPGLDNSTEGITIGNASDQVYGLDPMTWANDTLSTSLNAMSNQSWIFNTTLVSQYARQLFIHFADLRFSDGGASETGVASEPLPAYQNGAVWQTSTCISSATLAGYLNEISPLTQNMASVGPWTIQAQVSGGIAKVPSSHVTCESYDSSVMTRNLSLMFGDDDSQNPFIESPINLTSIWSEDMLRNPNGTYFEWIQLEKSAKMIAGLILTKSSHHGRANVSSCITKAAWIPSTMWTSDQSWAGGFETQGLTWSNFTYERDGDYFTFSENGKSHTQFCGLILQNAHYAMDEPALL